MKEQTAGDGGELGWLAECASPYLGERASEVLQTFVRSREFGKSASALRWRLVDLPPWAEDIGVAGQLLIDESALCAGDGSEWQRCDWLLTIWLYLTGAAERQHEVLHGPIHSYALRLSYEGHPLLYRHAWVNRIFLFLRRAYAFTLDANEEAFFGALPRARILLTHDVDAITLTPEIRLKQAAFQLFNAAKSGVSLKWDETFSTLRGTGRFLFAQSDFRTLGRVREAEREAGVTSRLHFYAGPPGAQRGGARAKLIDPAYDVADNYLVSEIRAFQDGGWEVGLHQSSGAWRSPEAMASEKRRLECATATQVTCCRQHWLKFSWTETWAAQAQAGFTEDGTLGFNDRPAFRASHALRLRPWSGAGQAPLPLHITPMIFMDSHFYDYQPMREDARPGAMSAWLDEVQFVHGEAAVNWHTHTITEVYGWGGGYETLLRLLGQLSSP